MQSSISELSPFELFSALHQSIRGANEICRRWSGGLRDLRSEGSEFILHYEVARCLAEMSGDSGAQILDFDQAAVDAQRWWRARLVHKVSRNTRRRYLVVRGAHPARITLLHVQRYALPDYFASETKGAARAMLKYGFVESVIMVGVGGWLSASAGHTVHSTYEIVDLAFQGSLLEELVLELPDGQQFSDLPPIMLARIKRAE